MDLFSERPLLVIAQVGDLYVYLDADLELLIGRALCLSRESFHLFSQTDKLRICKLFVAKR
jgi:hypothetical protein